MLLLLLLYFILFDSLVLSVFVVATTEILFNTRYVYLILLYVIFVSTSCCANAQKEDFVENANMIIISTKLRREVLDKRKNRDRFKKFFK